ncbi:MAG: DUF6382 domain-containing protein [Eubacteriales bacterium]|nr:DUF6382 domain-containing protein [Eubacteriales bacterium]
MKLSYIRDMAHNYMVPECGQIIDENDYRIHMLTENRIRGLLPCTVKKTDGNNCFYYDITSKQSLEHIYGRGSMGETEILALLRGLYSTLREIKKYLLDSSMIILEPQMIYMDIETKEPVFCYLPGYQKDITRSFQELSAYILEHICQADERAVLLGYEIYRKAREENYSLEKILKVSGEEKRPKEPAAPAATQKAGTISVMPVIKEPDWDMFSAKAEMSKAAYCSEPDREAGRAPEKKSAKNPEKKTEKAEIRSDRKNERKGGGKVFIITCFAFAVILFAAAAVLWGMDTTQIGGIIFFLSFLLIYGCVVDKRKRKKKTEKKEKDMPYMVKEQPYIYEETYSKKKSEPERVSEFERISDSKRKKGYSKTQAFKVKEEGERFGNTGVLPEHEETTGEIVLVSMSADGRKTISLTRERYVIGKLKSQADIVLDHHSISRIHAQIQKERGAYYLYDLNSTNGTYYNGRRMEVNERVLLQPGDEIAFARVGFYVESGA